MKLTPDDEASIPSREAFYGVGSSRTSLCPSPEEENLKEDVSYDALSKNVNGNHSKDELERIPLSGMICDNKNIENGMVVADNQQKCDHHAGDVDLDGVPRQFKGDNDVNERRIGQENDEGGDDVAKKYEERLSTDNNVDVDVDTECHDPQVKDDVVDDPNCNGILEGKLRTSMQQDENDEDNSDPSLSHPPTKITPTDSPSTIQYSVSGNLRRSSQLPRKREHGEPSQQALGSTRSLHSSMSKRQNKSSRRSSGASRRTIRSERSSSLSSTASLETSSTSSSGSATDSDSSSSSPDSNSDSESYSSSGSSSRDSSSCSSCNESSDGESSDSEPSSSGSESESSSNDEADSDDIRYRISAEKYRRTSRRGSGPSSSVSFGPDGHADMRTDKKSGGKRSHKTRKPSYSMIPQRRGYDLTDGIVHQETCSTVCVIL